MTVFEDHESEVRSYCRGWPAVFDHAAGSRMWDVEGHQYLDFFAGAGALNYGHNPPVLREALIDYLTGDHIVHALDMHTRAKGEFLETFDEVVLAPRGLDYKVQFPGPTGTNAVEAALKLARKVTGRTRVVGFTNGFHGMSLGSLSVTGNLKKRRGAGISLPESAVMPYDGYLDGAHPGPAEQAHAWFARVLDDPASGFERPAAVIVETVQGEGGINVARDEWLRVLADLCRRHEILLVVDDVQMGVGRTGPFFSFESAGIHPDIVCVSKSISGYGLPMALVLMRPEHDVWSPGEHNGTFRGNNPAFVTATAALRTFWADDELATSTVRAGEAVHQALSRTAYDVRGLASASARGRGLARGLRFDQPELAEAVAAEAFRRGLLIETAGPRDEVLKLMPALTIPSADLEAGLEIIDSSVRTVVGAPDRATAVPA
jgi:diaminobutyrate-2-oxoglutarate transaminase